MVGVPKRSFPKSLGNLKQSFTKLKDGTTE